MGPEIVTWVHIVHVIGVVLWISGMIAVFALLRAHAEVDGVARETLSRIERTTAVLMDLGATLAIATGVYMTFKDPKFPTTAFASGGWFHIKLTLVVLVVLGLHGMARAKIKRFRLGTIKPLPTWVVPVLLLAVTAIVILARHGALLRK